MRFIKKYVTVEFKISNIPVTISKELLVIDMVVISRN